MISKFNALTFSLLLAAWLLFSSALSFAIIVDLKDPEYIEGVISTEKGGVICDNGLRIQAKLIKYTNIKNEQELIMKIEAEENLLIEFGEYLFVGTRLEYDFVERTGIIYNGRTFLEPWYFGGRYVRLCPDGSYLIEDGFVTTSENIDPEWHLLMKSATVSGDYYLRAKNIQLKYCDFPFFWIPSYSIDLTGMLNSPLSYNLKWGGRRGTRVGVIYEALAWNQLTAYIRADYRFKRGLGGGTEAHYRSPARKHTYDSINYIAYDNSITHPHERVRYRFQGRYHGIFDQDRITVDLTYDKLSDNLMATDYADNGLELDTAEKTRLLARRQGNLWIANFQAHARINGFQTLKQQLPTFALTWRPLTLWNTGIISESAFEVSYLDFVYANDTINAHDYNSTRVEFMQTFYRPFRSPYLTLTPQATGLSIYYGNNPDGHPRWLNMGLFSLTAEANFYRTYNSMKHVIQPYSTYYYYTMPLSPNQHDIFDIDDGWFRLNMLKFGVQQDLYTTSYFSRILSADLYSYAFFDTPDIKSTLPTVYTDVTFRPTQCLKYVLNFGWDFREGELARFNIRKEWTYSKDLALALEYRHRSSFDWRKVDHTNFILDSFRSPKELLHSTVSDRRDTLLFHLFYRFHPSLALEVESRHGWKRRLQPSYTEYFVELHATLRSAWHMKVAFEHKVKDTRFSISMFMDIYRPNQKKLECMTPLLDF